MVASLPIFMGDAKIIFGYNFIALLKKDQCNVSEDHMGS